jgi:hypothetical protein
MWSTCASCPETILPQSRHWELSLAMIASLVRRQAAEA